MYNMGERRMFGYHWLWILYIISIIPFAHDSNELLWLTAYAHSKDRETSQLLVSKMQMRQKI